MIAWPRQFGKSLFQKLVGTESVVTEQNFNEHFSNAMKSYNESWERYIRER